MPFRVNAQNGREADVNSAKNYVFVERQAELEALDSKMKSSRVSIEPCLWRQGIPSQRAERDTELTPLVRAIFWKHKRRYGARRIASELADLGEVCSPRRVAKIMKIQRLRAIQPKSFVPKTTDSRHGLGYSPNLLLEAPDPTGINQLWVGDITYVPLVDGTFCYLALLMDRYSRYVVGWQLADTMTEPLVLAALRMAIHARQPPRGLIHHTDRGGQYAGTRYRGLLRRADFRQSMNRADNCYDNAFMESCFGTTTGFCRAVCGQAQQRRI